MSKGVDVEAGNGRMEQKTLKDYLGDDVAARVRSASESAPVVIFGKAHCPFCIEVRRLFAQLGVQPVNFDVDVMPEGAEAWDALKKMHAPQKTVPYVFVNKVLVGGCDDTKRLHSAGELHKMLAVAGVTVVTAAPTSAATRYGKCGVLEAGAPAGGTLFHFPEVLDNRVVRFNGFWSFVICLLVAVFYKERAAHWVMGGLMVEYGMRLLGGGNVSALGALSGACAALLDVVGSRPKFVGGPPKQFATLCGLMFSSLAFFFYLVSVYERKLINVGLAVTCALGMAALLECAIDFCLGCWMFQMMNRFGLVSSNVYQTFINTKEEAEYTWNDQNTFKHEGAPQVLVKRFDDTHPLKVDYHYKTKTDDMTREDFHPVKHVKLTHFVMHLGVVGVACAWRAADVDHSYIQAPPAVWYAIGIGAAIWYFSFVVLYLAKIVMYPKKVAKELAHNVNGNCFALPWVILVLFAYLVEARNPEFAKVLFWIGAPTSLFLSLVWVGGWIALKKELEHVNASWMMMPVGNFVAAAVGPMLDSAYTDACQFWFAFALLLWLGLFIITLYKSFVMPDYDDRTRPMLATWVAAPAIGAVAYLSCYGPNMMATAVRGPLGQLLAEVPAPPFNDFIFINMYWMSIACALVLGVCFFRPYFARLRWDMSYWAASFPAAAMTMCSMYYNSVKPGGLSKGIALTCLFVCSWLTAMLLLHTLTALLKLQVFTPDYKWGPMSFMRLTHEALRGVLPRLQREAAEAQGGSEGSLAALRATWQAVVLAHHEHGRHEDDVIFPTYREFFPHVTAEADQQHQELDAAIDSISSQLEALGGGKAGPEAAGQLSAAVERYAVALQAHLRWEEDHLQTMPRKYIPLELSKQIIRKCWAATPATTWHVLLPLLLESMPMLVQRVRFVKTLLWAMPERCHQFGLILAKGLDAVEWRRVSAELPEIIPRGVNMLWERYY